MAVFSGSLSGVTFSPSKENLSFVSRGLPMDLKLKLVHDKNNKFDKNAIMVIEEKSNLQIGWIPKNSTMLIHNVGIDNVKCFFSKYNMDEFDVIGVSVEVVSC